MKDINEKLRVMTEKAKRKAFNRTIKCIIADIKDHAKRGYDYVEHRFWEFNISGESFKAAIIEELRNKGYNVRSRKDEDEFIVDWSETNDN